jgi:hypothetical protein
MRKTRTLSLKQFCDQLEYSPKELRGKIVSGELDAQKVAGTYLIGAREACQLAGMEIPDWWTPLRFYSVNGAAKYLGIDSRRIRALAASGDLDYDKIETLGKHGWAMIFLERDLDGINTSPLRRGPAPTGDEHINQIDDGRFEIVGTRDSKGRSYRYLRLAVARRRAREAYQDGLLYKTGDQVFVGLNIKELRQVYGARTILATLVEDVTHIDKSIIVQIGQNTHRLSRGSLGELATDLVIQECGNCGGSTYHYCQGKKGPICTVCRRTAPVLDVKRMADDAQISI